MEQDIWNNPEFKEWYNSKPPKIRELIKQFPPGHKYCVQDGSFPATVCSYDEENDGSVSMTMNIYSPFMPRSVSGVKPDDVKKWQEP